MNDDQNTNNMSLDSLVKLLSLNKNDNVLIALGSISNGETLSINETQVTMKGNVQLSHKIASKNITKGEKIIKYGVPIGSAMSNISMGEHVHVHNMTSDYTKTHVLEETKDGDK